MSEFEFVFPDGRRKRSGEMTREELLEVIDHAVGERRCSCADLHQVNLMLTVTAIHSAMVKLRP